MYKIVALILLCCLSVNSKIDVVSANSYSRFLYPTNSINDNILYFNQYDGTIVKQNIATGSEEIVLILFHLLQPQYKFLPINLGC